MCIFFSYSHTEIADSIDRRYIQFSDIGGWANVNFRGTFRSSRLLFISPRLFINFWYSTSLRYPNVIIVSVSYNTDWIIFNIRDRKQIVYFLRRTLLCIVYISIKYCFIELMVGFNSITRTWLIEVNVSNLDLLLSRSVFQTVKSIFRFV